MDLQFLTGNPILKKPKKRIAKGNKKRSLRESRMTSMAKKRVKRRKNPVVDVYSASKKVGSGAKFVHNHTKRYATQAELKKVKTVLSRMKNLTAAARKKAAKHAYSDPQKHASAVKTYEKMEQHVRQAQKEYSDAESKRIDGLKSLAAAKRRGINVYSKTTETGAKKVAKRRKKKKSDKKVKRVKKNKSPKRAKRVKKNKSPKRAKRVKHRRSRRSRKFIHLKVKSGGFKKGQSKSRVTARRGRKQSYSISKLKRTNPSLRRNPMKFLDDMKSAVKTKDLLGVAIGGALYPVVDTVVNKALAAAPASIQNIVASNPALKGLGGVILGAALVAASKKASGDVGKYLEMAGRGIVTTSVVGTAMAVSSSYLIPMVPGLSGVMFTPLSGVQFTPNMSGVQFTPNMSGMPQLGNSPQLGVWKGDFGDADFGPGGYSDEHRFSNADMGDFDEDGDYSDSEEDQGLG